MSTIDPQETLMRIKDWSPAAKVALLLSAYAAALHPATKPNWEEMRQAFPKIGRPQLIQSVLVDLMGHGLAHNPTPIDVLTAPAGALLQTTGHRPTSYDPMLDATAGQLWELIQAIFGSRDGAEIDDA